jgi:hypothetical protein
VGVGCTGIILYIYPKKMEPTLLLDDSYDLEEDAQLAIDAILDNYDTMTAENGQLIANVEGEAGQLVVSKEYLAELGKHIVRIWLALLGVPYPLLP